jgi:hypothetical protein
MPTDGDGWMEWCRVDNQLFANIWRVKAEEKETA